MEDSVVCGTRRGSGSVKREKGEKGIDGRTDGGRMVCGKRRERREVRREEKESGERWDATHR